MNDNRISSLALFASSGMIFDRKNAFARSEDMNYTNLPSILSMRLSEWIAALTHPTLGAFPNGISPKQLDRLAQNQIAHVSMEIGREVRPVWKSSNHLGVMLWNEVKAGRVIRLHKACYVGAKFREQQKANECGIDNAENVKDLMLSTSINQHEFQAKNTPHIYSEKSTANEWSNKEEFQCRVCKQGFNETGINGVLKCIGCAFQCHTNCAYPNNTVPTNLSKRLPAAIAVWRCYDCKACHLCGGKDDVNDGLLLCDGCDSGEHMGCQAPPTQDVPPAPWFCSLCRRATTDAVFSSSASHQHTSVTVSSPFDSTALIIDESDEKAAITVIESAATSPDCPSNQSEVESNGHRPRSGTTSSLPIWSHMMVKASPTLSDETPELEKRRLSETSGGTTPTEEKPIRKKLGKRAIDGQWIIGDDTELTEPPRRRRRQTHKRGSDQIMSQSEMEKELVSRSNSSSSLEKGLKFHFGSRGSQKEKDEMDLLPFMSEDLPLLNDEDTKNVQGAKLWSVEDTAAFMDRMGFSDSAKAFAREEIDGAALLLLKRQDVLLNLGLKLGSALKTYKFVRYIQSTVRSN